MQETHKKKGKQLMQRKASSPPLAYAIYGIIENLFAFAATLMDLTNGCMREMATG